VSILRGDADGALGYLEEALAVLKHAGTPPLIKSWALWLRAEIYLHQQQLKRAERDFAELKQIYHTESMSALDVALVSLRLAKVLLLESKISELHQLTVEMLSLLEPLQKDHKLLAGAFEEFLRLAMGGRLTPGIVEKAYGVMRRGARKTPPILTPAER
jgi:tetratricopeptide (TPR) repeat protein